MTPRPNSGLLLTTPAAVGWQYRQRTRTPPPRQRQLLPAAIAGGERHRPAKMQLSGANADGTPAAPHCQQQRRAPPTGRCQQPPATTAGGEHQLHAKQRPPSDNASACQTARSAASATPPNSISWEPTTTASPTPAPTPAAACGQNGWQAPPPHYRQQTPTARAGSEGRTHVNASTGRLSKPAPTGRQLPRQAQPQRQKAAARRQTQEPPNVKAGGERHATTNVSRSPPRAATPRAKAQPSPASARSQSRQQEAPPRPRQTPRVASAGDERHLPANARGRPPSAAMPSATPQKPQAAASRQRLRQASSPLPSAATR